MFEYKTKYFYKMMNARLGASNISQLRRELLAHASGKVLEIGFGSGLNLPWYPEHIQEITAIDPTSVIPVTNNDRVQTTVLTMSAEEMDFEENSFDTVTCTYTLCSIPNPAKALNEIRRILKPQGKFLFLEHGKSANTAISAMQNLVNPFYRLIACGCNVNRNVQQLIMNSGLKIETLKIIHSAFPISGIYYSGIAKNQEPYVS